MIDGDSLRAFVAIAEHRSFSRAADRLGIVQSVISKRLRRLEDQLGAPLIHRAVKSDIRLTHVGQLYLNEARETLAQLAKAERIGRNLARGSTGPVNIGYIFSAAMNGTLNRLLRTLRASSGELELRPRLLETPQQMEELEAGLLDVGLMRPRPTYPAGCHAAIVHREPVLLCLSSDHPLARQPSLAPASLADERFIVPQFHEQVGLIDSLRSLAKAGGFALSDPMRTDDFVTAASLAAAGGGVVLAPASLANLKLEGLTFRTLDGFDGSLACALVWRADVPEHARRLFERIGDEQADL